MLQGGKKPILLEIIKYIHKFINLKNAGITDDNWLFLSFQ